MVKNSNSKIEKDKKRIIEFLLHNSRQSPNEIAKKLGFSRQKVWKVIKELEKDKIFWGYTAVVDDISLDRNIYFALSRIKKPLFDRMDDIIDSVNEDTEDIMDIGIHGSYYINGKYDWIVIFSAKNIRNAKRFCAHIHEQYYENLDRIDLMECVFPLIKYGKLNPNIEKIKDYTFNEVVLEK